MMNKIKTILSEARKNTEYSSAYDIETNCEIHNRLYGENSCFLVAEDYHGLYHDDYASFTYYSNVTGEYFEDSWTTAACCPSYDCYKLCKSFDEAVKEGLIDINIYNSTWNPSRCEISDFLKKNTSEFYRIYRIYPFVEIYRGRSHKNRKGWRISEKTIYNKGYGSIMEIIFDPEVNEFFMVRKGYTKLEDEFVKKIENAINSHIDSEMKVNDRMRTIDRNLIVRDTFFEGNFEDWRYNMDIKRSIWEANYDAEQEKKTYAPSEKLLQWVRDHFKNVTDENEIYNIAYRINKKNARRY